MSKPNNEQPDLTRRLGCFKVSVPLVDSHPEEVIRAISDVLIVRCEMRYDTAAFHYVGMSEHFDIIDPYVEPPSYSVQVSRREDGSLSVTFVREASSYPSAVDCLSKINQSSSHETDR